MQSTKTYKAFQAFQPQDLTQAFQFYKDIPDIPVIHDIPTLQTLLHVPAPSSTIQYLPVLSSAIQCYPVYPGIPPVPAFLQLECNSTHRLVSTRNSIEYQSNTRHYINFHSSKKGRCCDIGHNIWHILQNRITGQDDI